MARTSNVERGQAWFALADAESCRLLACSLTRRGKHHVREYDAMLNTLPEQEHIRPMTGGGTTHNVENKERCFGGEILAWLRSRADQYAIDRLVIFAPPRMLGVLRAVPLGTLKGHVEELEGNLMRLNAGQLAAHSRIRELLTPMSGNEGAAVEFNVITTPGGTAGSRPDQPDGRCITA